MIGFAEIVAGLSAPRFASLHGMPYQTLVSWIRKGKPMGTADTPRTLHPALLSLVPAEIDYSTSIAVGLMRRLATSPRT